MRKTRGKAKHSRYIKNRDWLLKRDYGISLEQWDELMLLQGGMCAICEKEFMDQLPQTDHNHRTGKVRGLLCTRCNAWMAVVDRPLWFSKAEKYKKNPPSEGVL